MLLRTFPNISSSNFRAVLYWERRLRRLIILELDRFLGKVLFQASCLLDGSFRESAIPQLLLQAYGMGELGLVASDIVELFLQFLIMLKLIVQLAKPTEQTALGFLLVDVEDGLLVIGIVVAHLLHPHILELVACSRISIDVYFHVGLGLRGYIDVILTTRLSPFR